VRPLVAAALLLALVAPVEAIPACYHLAPSTGPIPYGTITPDPCTGPDRFVLAGADVWGSVYLELPASALWISGNGLLQPEGIWAPDAYFYLRVLYQGDVSLINPNIYITQFLLGSDWFPESARWWHEHVGIPEWGPYEAEPLAHTPEPSTLVLLGTAGLVLGWRWRRGR
jgi:PEP-CTERM motif